MSEHTSCLELCAAPLYLRSPDDDDDDDDDDDGDDDVDENDDNEEEDDSENIGVSNLDPDQILSDVATESSLPPGISG